MSRSDRFPNGVANSSDAVGRYLMDHPVQLTRALSPVPVRQRRGPREVSAIHEMCDGNHRRQHGAFVTNVGNQGWEWAGPNLATLAKGFVDAGLYGPELLNAVRSHSSREMTLVALTEQLPHLENRITPDFDRLDAIGVPKPRIFFRLDDYNATALANTRERQKRHCSGAKNGLSVLRLQPEIRHGCATPQTDRFATGPLCWIAPHHGTIRSADVRVS
jgi:glucose dehydrogenase